MSSLTVVTPETAPLLPLSLVKSHCRVTIADDDELLKLYTAAAVDLAESSTGRSFVNKLLCQTHDRFPSLHDWGDFGTGYFYQTRRYARGHHDHHHRQEIKLLRSPLVGVQSIVYVDLNGALQTLRPAPQLWQPNNEYTLGDQVQDANGNLQEITVVADSGATNGKFISGSSTPSWAQSVNLTTTDGPFTWACRQVPAYAGDFLVDSDSEPGRVTPLYGQSWPQTQHVMNAVQIFFTAGYGNSGAAVPATGKVLTLQMVGNWYENRESVTDETLKTIPNHLEELVWSLRVLDFAPTH
jgi:hypothetical protein